MKEGTYMDERRTKLQELNSELKFKSDDQLEELYRNCQVFEMKRDESYTSEDFNSMKKDFERATNEKAGFAVMERYISGEIARRWRKQRQLLKDFKELFI